jgi:hypothetical protein
MPARVRASARDALPRILLVGRVGVAVNTGWKPMLP